MATRIRLVGGNSWPRSTSARHRPRIGLRKKAWRAASWRCPWWSDLVVFRHPSEKWWSSSVGFILTNIYIYIYYIIYVIYYIYIYIISYIIYYILYILYYILYILYIMYYILYYIYMEKWNSCSKPPSSDPVIIVHIHGIQPKHLWWLNYCDIPVNYLYIYIYCIYIWDFMGAKS